MSRKVTRRPNPPAQPAPKTERTVSIPLIAQPEPVDVFAMAIGGAQQVLRQLQGLDAFRTRLETYRLLFPERYGHVLAFTDGVDQPTPEQVQAILEKAAAAKK